MKLLRIGNENPLPLHLGYNAPDGVYVCRQQQLPSLTTTTPSVLILRGDSLLRENGVLYMFRRELEYHYQHWTLQESEGE